MFQKIRESEKMLDFLMNLQKTAATYPDRLAVVDREGKRTTTYRELYTAALLSPCEEIAEADMHDLAFNYIEKNII